MAKSCTFCCKYYWGGVLVHLLSCGTGRAFKFQVYFFKKSCKAYINDMYFFKLGFTPRKNGQPLTGVKLQEKEI